MQISGNLDPPLKKQMNDESTLIVSTLRKLGQLSRFFSKKSSKKVKPHKKVSVCDRSALLLNFCMIEAVWGLEVEINDLY